MKPWIKILLGIFILWIYIGTGLLIWFTLKIPGSEPGSIWLWLAMTTSIISCLITAPVWLFLTVYVIFRKDLSIAKRLLWAASFIAGPIVLIALPLFFFFYVYPHPSNKPVLNPCQ